MEVTDKPGFKVVREELCNSRKIFGQFATGVCILLIEEQDLNYQGLTINSFSSLSLSPLLVTFSLKTKSIFYSKLNEFKKNFSINILQKEQKFLSNQCSQAGGSRIEASQIIKLDNAYYINHCLASIDCRVNKKIPAGDHTIIVCDVISMAQTQAQDPLLFFASNYREIKE